MGSNLIALDNFIMHNSKPTLFHPSLSTCHVSNTDYAFDGVYVSHQNLHRSFAVKVGCICDVFPIWALSFTNKMFNIAWIIVLQDSFLSTICHWFPNTTICLHSTLDSSSEKLPNIDVLAINGSGVLLQPLRPSQCSFLLFDFRMRHTKGWKDWRF